MIPIGHKALGSHTPPPKRPRKRGGLLWIAFEQRRSWINHDAPQTSPRSRPTCQAHDRQRQRRSRRSPKRTASKINRSQDENHRLQAVTKAKAPIDIPVSELERFVGCLKTDQRRSWFPPCRQRPRHSNPTSCTLMSVNCACVYRKLRPFDNRIALPQRRWSRCYASY